MIKIGPLKRLLNEPFIDYCTRRFEENAFIKHYLKGSYTVQTHGPNRKQKRVALKHAQKGTGG